MVIVVETDGTLTFRYTPGTGHRLEVEGAWVYAEVMACKVPRRMGETWFMKGAGLNTRGFDLCLGDHLRLRRWPEVGISPDWRVKWIEAGFYWQDCNAVTGTWQQVELFEPEVPAPWRKTSWELLGKLV